jgi:hypothetical protein
MFLSQLISVFQEIICKETRIENAVVSLSHNCSDERTKSAIAHTCRRFQAKIFFGERLSVVIRLPKFLDQVVSIFNRRP